MIHVTCRLTAKNLNQRLKPTLGNRVWATFFVQPDKTGRNRIFLTTVNSALLLAFSTFLTRNAYMPLPQSCNQWAKSGNVLRAYMEKRN